MSRDVGVTERLENEQSSQIQRYTAKLILQAFRRFTCVTTHSPTLPSLYLRHSSFSNPSVASPTTQFILQPFFRFPYGTSSSLNSPGEPPMSQTMLQSISTLKAGGHHAIQGQRGEVKTSLTNQTINHLAVQAEIIQPDYKFTEFTSLCKLLCCYVLL